jgi:uncharacterized protein YciI
MLFAVIFRDKPGHGAVRQQWLDAHIRWVDEHSDVVRVAGSLRHELGDVPIGGLWIVEAESKAAVDALLRTDPFWTAGLRESVEILHWSKALDRLTPV